ncbi:imidazolonepropionase [Sphingorhabdus soli]|uniref:Imidazolonepropionase n=1 Tax=Flavisphingopyxis soli TaxID=2601267 RepID=A0A5C6UTI2_9SPHN|nr:imidazolonepropionase [Sphingorhabdus soli]TXC74258.1 imidazolonepropionase [Sphingorhabdus soli]
MLLLTDALIAPINRGNAVEYSWIATIAVADGQIAFVGNPDDIPATFAEASRHSLAGRLVTPGLIDCHTHLVYAGSRAREFELRQQGATYETIMRAGGGIFSTVAATRAASAEELLAGALKRIDRLIAEGVTTVEIKSGYGLDRDTELRMLRVARDIEQHRAIRVSTTFLGAHAFPKEIGADAYLEETCLPTLKKAAAEGLVDAVDGFCENVGFSATQMARVFDVARELGLPVKLHAEQLSDQGGAALAARYGALSADHLEYVGDDGIAAMAASDMVAVLLPGAFYMLKETQLPPVEKLRAAGVPMALATDGNPGSAPMSSILLAMNMGAVLFGLTPEECLRGVTEHAAQALGLSDRGTIAVGMRADLAIWDVTDPAELSYRIGDAPLYQRVFEGRLC